MLGRFFDYYGVGFICRDDPRLARCNRDRLTGCILMQLEQMLAISEEQPECFFTVGGRKRNRRIFDSAQKKNEYQVAFSAKEEIDMYTTSELSRFSCRFSGQFRDPCRSAPVSAAVCFALFLPSSAFCFSESVWPAARSLLACFFSIRFSLCSFVFSSG
jgi:hypothetical protein